MAEIQGLDLVGLQMPQGWELLIILALVFLLFGAKKMPDAARGIGKSLRILKTETKGLRDEDETPTETNQVAGSETEQITATSTGSEPQVDVSSPKATADVRTDADKAKKASASES